VKYNYMGIFNAGVHIHRLYSTRMSVTINYYTW